MQYYGTEPTTSTGKYTLAKLVHTAMDTIHSIQCVVYNCLLQFGAHV